MGSPGTPRFEIDESQAEDGTVVLALGGELDLATVPDLQERVEAARKAGNALRIDLRPLKFLDSSGLRVLLGAAVESRNDGWRFEVVPGEGAVDRIFDTAGVRKVIPFVSPD